MAKTATMTIRIDPQIKADAEDVREKPDKGTYNLSALFKS